MTKGAAVAQKISAHPRIFERHPEVSEEDVVSAWENALAISSRTYEPPDIYAAAGADSKGRLLEMLGVELEDGTMLIYHAMKLTKKISKELGLS